MRQTFLAAMLPSQPCAQLIDAIDAVTKQVTSIVRIRAASRGGPGELRFLWGRGSWRVIKSTDSPARFGALLGFLGVTFAAAAIGSVATFQSVATWYPTLAKPAWTPPSAVFGPVWTLLYIAMAVAGWRVWRTQTGVAARAVLRHYGAQLLLNALWSILFFGMRRPDLALLDIAALWMLLVLAQVRFWRADRIAGLLWAPYLLWVSYASSLNAAIWLMNR